MVLSALLYRINYIIFAPFNFPDMIWVAAPLLISLIMIELYFGRYSSEELGWNSAISNSLVLIFVALDLFRKVFDKSLPRVSFPATKFLI